MFPLIVDSLNADYRLPQLRDRRGEQIIAVII
jgi:hypothetical protein